MAKRTRISTGTPLEIEFRYSRAVRVGDLVFVSGTTAMKDGALVGVGDAGAQTRQVLANIVWALGQAGAPMTAGSSRSSHAPDLEETPAPRPRLVRSFWYAPAIHPRSKLSRHIG